ncbi:hypothetical protein [Spiroplasma clarkii]|uniref:hypothetical protein n=1 Tax=Spiroplasma clarkii TaxID=2139 RepID=UPI0011BADC57|nr:hypothetical protein [Spiroplasma clarkii]
MKIVGIIKEFKTRTGVKAVARIERLDQVENTFIRGDIKTLKINIPYEFKGEFAGHKSYHKIFETVSYQPTTQLDNQQTINYLKSSVFDTIGEKSATMIVEQIPVDTLSKIITTPELLKTVPDLELEKINTLTDTLKQLYNTDSISEKFLENNLKEEFYDFLVKDCLDDEEVWRILTNYFFEYADENNLSSFEEVDKVVLSFDTTNNLLEKRIYWWAYKYSKDILFTTGNTWLKLADLRKKFKKSSLI